MENFQKLEQAAQNLQNFTNIIFIAGILVFMSISLYNTLMKIVRSDESQKRNVFVPWMLALILWLILFYSNYYMVNTLESVEMALMTTIVFVLGTTVILLLNISIYVTRND